LFTAALCLYMIMYTIVHCRWWLGGRNRSSRGKPPTCHWQMLSHNVVSSTPRHQRASNSQL